MTVLLWILGVIASYLCVAIVALIVGDLVDDTWHPALQLFLLPLIIVFDIAGATMAATFSVLGWLFSTLSVLAVVLIKALVNTSDSKDD